MKKSYNEFLTLVKTECKKYGVKCDIRKGKYVKLNSFKCGGYFFGDTDKPILVVAGGRPDAAAILVHEYCHLTQWAENIPLWNKSTPSMVALDEWLTGNDVRNIKKHLGLCRDLELDNEIRASKFIRKYDLNITTGDYIKRANAYVLFYNWLLVSRKWSSPKNSPYTNKKLINAMSRKFDMNYKKLDPNIAEIFKSEGI